ncbi:polymorphic toxin-type HINT domain-containing protein [Streptomyces sp. NPDC001935]
MLVGTLLQATVAEAATASSSLPKTPASERPLSGHGVRMLPRKLNREPRLPKQRPKHAWAKTVSTTLTLASGSKSAATASDLPVSLIPAEPTTSKASATAGRRQGRSAWAGKATVRVLDQKIARRSGVDGLLFTVQPHKGSEGSTAGIKVDYSGFAQAYGGAYAARLNLVQLPACALTSPKSKKCTGSTVIPTSNDTQKHTLTAASLSMPTTASTGDSVAASMVLAATTSTSSDHGDYQASPLSASSAWNTNLNTGDFSWSYNMPVPAVPGKFAPQVGLAYSSGSIDGRTANSNNQSSWVGDGFGLWPGSIERAYKPCADDGATNADGKKTGDLCWAYDNATMSFNGHSGELIADGTDSYKLKGDDGTKIDRLHGTTRDNGDNDQEYWRVTTTDGTRYYFGYNKLPGWTSGDETTDSTWTTPVYGDDDNEPCHASTFAASWCQQASRWNLDYAVDVHGNAIAYYYTKETNYYARNLTAADETAYDRGGYLDRIEYGLKSSAMYGTKPLAKVDFTSSERCLPQTGVTCDASTIDDKAFYWYDTPWDLHCTSGTDCIKAASPSFWTRKRLTAVTTQVLQPDNTYAPIDTWTLDHRWGTADIDYQLLLDSIQHTGKSTTSNITLPKVTLAYDQRANRLDQTGDNTAPFIKERLTSIADESGGQVDVNYSTAACDPANLPTPQTNATRCYPVYFTSQGDTDPSLQWFNKYVVDSVIQTDRTQASPDMVTRYSYLDGAAWHFDDDEGLTKEKYKTWSTWRGYGHVRVQTGGHDPVGMQSQTDHYFLRGMDGDKAAPTGGTRAVSVSDDNGGTITDHDSAAGFEYKSEQYSDPGGKVLSKTVNTPWHHETAKRVRSWGTTTANLTGIEGTRSWTSLDDGAGSNWRKTYKTNTFENTAGRITETSDYGDETDAKDNQCTRTTYVDNTTAWILDLPSRVETVAVKCADTPDRSKDVVADLRTAYDGQGYGVAPTKGDVTRSAALKSYNGSTATYLETESTYDSYGRQRTSTDLSANVTATETTTPVRTARTDGRTTTTDYAPTTGFATSTTVTTPAAVAADTTTAQTTTTTYDTLRGLPTDVVDTNNRHTNIAYDALGRKVKMWLPNRSQANKDTPNYEFTYTVNENGPTAVGTKTLKNDGTQRTSYTLYDGFLRPRQAQAPGPQGGRLVSDTFYDERGLTAKTFAPYYNTSAPATSLLALDDALAVETQSWSTYDGLGRILKSQQVAGNSDGGKVLSTTTTSYGGDRTTVTPPKGATPTTTFTDARGHTTDLWQYHATTPTGTADKTHYDYDPRTGKLAKLTDPSGNQWAYDYDQRGNQVHTRDPDKGDTNFVYDDRGQLTSATDNRGKSVTHVYDGLGRETETHEGEASGPLLTKHVWDPTGFEGQLASATRYIGGASGAAYTTTYSLYDTLYRPNRTTVTIPTAEGALAGSYQSNTKYNLDGTILSSSYPAAGSLASDVITPTYDEVLRTKKLTGTGGVTYLTDAVYSYTGKPLTYTYQATGAKKTRVTNSYQWGTQRLDNTNVAREDIAGTDKSATYGYDTAGNITSITDVSRDGTDNQCFSYDYLARLTEAWAQQTTTCAGAPSAAVLGGPAPYWQSYTYKTDGSRDTETLHDPTGATSKDVKRTYSYPAPGAVRPHGLTAVDSTGPTGIATESYSYDEAGNTKTRTIGGNKQTLEWDSEGHLAKVTADDGNGGTKTTSYTYDADGNRLISRSDTETTLHLATTQLTLAKGASSAKATRYYDLGGGNQAIRTDDNKLSFLIGDHHGTSELAINATDLSEQKRRSSPFGAPRGTQPTSWPGQKEFVGGTKDTTTGLTHLGARDYDPATGRFLSVDPIMDPTDPQQINGYTYSNSSPVTKSDPTGLIVANPDGRPCRGGWDECGPGDTSKPVNTGGGKGKDDGIDQAKDGQPKINGIRVPKFNELSMYAAWDEKSDTYAYRFKWWVRNQCTVGAPAQYDAFCHTAARVGLLGETVNDPFGIKANIHCVTGHGDCTEAIVTDLLTVASWGLGRVASSARFLAMADKAGEASTKMLQALKIICSFSPDTRVLMKNGRTKAIGKIKPGDKVEAANPKTGKYRGLRTVTARLVHHDSDLVDLKIRRSDGKTFTLHTTSGHPFWDDTAHNWISAGSLTPGHGLNTWRDQHVRLVSITERPGAADMYNLTVGQLHTYYVLAGNASVLVHNSGESCGTHLALGLTRETESGANLAQFAGEQGAVTWKDAQFVDLFPSGAWSDTALKSMIDRVVAGGGKISFNLRGVQDVEGVIAGRTAPGLPTSIELQHICGNAGALAATTFLNGAAPC